jgi:hypothetical protein
MPRFNNTLHVYGQEIWHDDVVIRGDKKALENLRDLIDKALKEKASVNDINQCFFVKDGEGFNVSIYCEGNMERTPLPYFDEVAKNDYRKIEEEENETLE